MDATGIVFWTRFTEAINAFAALPQAQGVQWVVHGEATQNPANRIPPPRNRDRKRAFNALDEDDNIFANRTGPRPANSTPAATPQGTGNFNF